MLTAVGGYPMITPLLILAITACGWIALSERWRLAPFWRRHDHKALWLGAIPTHDRDRVDELLSVLCDAFLIPLHYRFRLRPSDKLEAFYRRNTRGQLGDSLEYERLMLRLEDDFGIDAERLAKERPCTVGMRLARSASSQSRAPGPVMR